MIEFNCVCKKRLRARPSLMNKAVRCPHCKRIVEVPGPTTTDGSLADLVETPAAGSRGGGVPAETSKQEAGNDLVDRRGLQEYLASVRAEKGDAPRHKDTLWSKTIVERFTRLCPACQKRVPLDFKKCMHCGEYFEGIPRKRDCPNCGNETPFVRMPKSASELIRILWDGVTCQICNYKFERRTAVLRCASVIVLFVIGGAGGLAAVMSGIV